MSEVEYEVWVVDRVEGSVTILVDDEDGIVIEVASELLGGLAVEGAILRVPLGRVGEPIWTEAVGDREAEVGRRTEGRSIIEELLRRDPGGDIDLS